MSTNLSGTLVDSTGTVWKNAPIQIILQPPANTPGPYIWSGGAYNPMPPLFYTDNAGHFAITLPSNNEIIPSGSVWQIIIGPTATYPAFVFRLALITPTYDMSAFFSANAIIKLVPSLFVPRAYNDTEMQGVPNEGQLYFDTSIKQLKIFTSGAWANVSAGGGGMVYPPAGVPVSTGAAWSTSIDPATVPRTNIANTFTLSQTFLGGLTVGPNAAANIHGDAPGTNLYINSPAGLALNFESGNIVYFGDGAGGTTAVATIDHTGTGNFNGNVTAAVFIGKALIAQESGVGKIQLANNGGKGYIDFAGPDISTQGIGIIRTYKSDGGGLQDSAHIYNNVFEFITPIMSHGGDVKFYGPAGATFSIHAGEDGTLSGSNGELLLQFVPNVGTGNNGIGKIGAVKNNVAWADMQICGNGGNLALCQPGFTTTVVDALNIGTNLVAYTYTGIYKGVGKAVVRTNDGVPHLAMSCGKTNTSMDFGIDSKFDTDMTGNYNFWSGPNSGGGNVQVCIITRQGNATFAGTVTAAGKSFRIPHPVDSTKDLIHTCLEGPEWGVYYRGEATTVAGVVEVTLPPYFEALTYTEDRSVLLTVIVDDAAPVFGGQIAAGRIVAGKFKIYSEVPTVTIAWQVNAIRKFGDSKLVVEPQKAEVIK